MIRDIKRPYRPLLHFLFITGLVLCLPVSGKASDPSGASFTDKEAQAFIAEWVKLSQNNKNFDAVMGMYAGEVEFYKQGMVTKSAIAEDKRKYFDRWPQREHTLISIVLLPGSTDNEKQAEVIFHYKIQKGQKSLEGDAKTLVSLRKSQGRIVIISEKDLRAVSSAPGGPAASNEYIVWSGYGGVAWIGQQGSVLKRIKEKVPVSLVDDALYAIRIEKRTVKQADCESADFLRDPEAKPKLVNAQEPELSLIRIDRDGKEQKTVLVNAEDNEDGVANNEFDILGLVGQWLFVDRALSFYGCGGVHGATVHEMLIVNVETGTTIAAYPGQKKSSVEKEIFGVSSTAGRKSSTTATLFTAKEYGVILSALRKKALETLRSEIHGDEAEIYLSRASPLVSGERLALQVLLTAPTGYASSDGKWSSYTRSVAYPAPIVPQLLSPYRNIPPAVLKWWKATKAGSYPSWSEVPSSGPARLQLEKLFQ